MGDNQGKNSMCNVRDSQRRTNLQRKSKPFSMLVVCSPTSVQSPGIFKHSRRARRKNQRVNQRVIEYPPPAPAHQRNNEDSHPTEPLDFLWMKPQFQADDDDAVSLLHSSHEATRKRRMAL